VEGSEEGAEEGAAATEGEAALARLAAQVGGGVAVVEARQEALAAGAQRLEEHDKQQHGARGQRQKLARFLHRHPHIRTQRVVTVKMCSQRNRFLPRLPCSSCSARFSWPANFAN